MRVLLSAYQVDPTRGSEWAISWTWMLEHARLGNEVTCLTSVWGRGNREHLEEELERLALPNLSVEFVELPGPFKGWGHTDTTLCLYFRYLLWQRAAARVAKRLDAERGFDLIHHVSWGNLQMGSSMWRVGKPLLFGPAGGGQSAPRAFRRYFESGWRKEQVRAVTGWMLKTFSPNFRRVLERADRILVVNPETAELARGAAARVEQTLQSPFSEADFPVQPPERSESSELRLLWVGRLLPRKGLPLVLDALSRLGDVPWRLTVVGHGELEHRVPSWIEQYGLED
ncbi:MAG: glycosyltransferase, partial [Planctomycetota bacterium]